MNPKTIITLVIGMTMGVVGVNTSRALERPPAYLVVEYEITDPEGWREYVDGIRQIPVDRTFLARHAKGISLSGEPPKWIGILRYPSVEDALSYESSIEYTALKAVRDRSTKWRAYIVEGPEASN